MKLAFISDIHGNATALDAVLRDLANKNVDQIYVLGDVCYRGPEPKRSLELVRSLRTQVIKGNADEWVVRGVRQGEVPDPALDMMNAERDWIVSQLEQGDIDFLSGLPTELSLDIEGVGIRAYHATSDSLFDVVLPHADEEELQRKLMTAEEASIYVYGHIHRPYIRYVAGKIVINTGSVGLPFDGLAKASYAIVHIEQGRISTSIERVDYDVEQVVRQYEAAGYPNTEMMTRIVRNGKLG